MAQSEPEPAQSSEELPPSTLGAMPLPPLQAPPISTSQLARLFGETATAPASLPAGAETLPTGEARYQRIRLHASGGVGQVWLVRDAALGRDIALKELRPDRGGDAQLEGRFLTEARITGQLEHPSIVPIYELARRPGDDQPYYTMRFLKGKTLSAAVQEYHMRRRKGAAGPLDLQKLLSAFLGVCNAIAYAHARGVVHRDLKGLNIFIGDYGEVMVLDWGLAKAGVGG